jgi:hypothetical protein
MHAFRAFDRVSGQVVGALLLAAPYENPSVFCSQVCEALEYAPRYWWLSHPQYYRLSRLNLFVLWVFHGFFVLKKSKDSMFQALFS